ncbi:recombinase family protein [[Clostridium] colinum]|uniref:recombinase family protein n=1 Tax=[Clostridium] colinum TaxID=36835 RepID=UPI0020244E26|nr:recombinase family protein [[Clostridium] colinum]
MARKSRVNLQLNLNNPKKSFQVGAYVRLSILNNNTDDENTIENQKNIILNYINNNNDFELVKFYEDNNKTGTNFNRKGFESLLEDIKYKKINCIIVKDLSRFGRDYKECSNYIENILPFLNIRFIAINDNFDSVNIKNNDILSVHLKNIVNEIYSKDISKKVSSALQSKRKKGQYLCTIPTYGYLKDTQNKGKVIVDEKASEVVKKIFNWRLQNKSYNEILFELEKLNIDAPYKHFYNLGLFKTDKYANVKWNKECINRILNNDFYIGNLTQGKTIQTISNNHKKINLPKEEWVVIHNNHIPIIDEDTFNQVKDINNHLKQKYFKEHNTNINDENILKGIIKCGYCDKNIRLVKNIKKNYVDKRFTCSNKLKYKDRCNFKSIKEEIILNIILETIKLQLKLAKNLNEIVKSKKYLHKFELEKKCIEDKVNKINFEIDNINNIYDIMYNDYLENVLNKEDYIYNKTKYKQKELKLKDELIKLNQDLNKIEERFNDKNFINEFLIFEDKEILTKEMILKLIDEIVIYNDKKLKIAFKFCDRFDEIKSFK